MPGYAHSGRGASNGAGGQRRGKGKGSGADKSGNGNGNGNGNGKGNGKGKGNVAAVTAGDGQNSLLHHTTGDLMESTAEYIVHQTNCVSTNAKGIAKVIFEK